MKTVVQISASDSKREVSGDDDGDPSVANLRTKRKHDVFKHLLTRCRKNVFGVRKSTRISKNQATKFSNTLDNPICLDSPDMSDILASTANKGITDLRGNRKADDRDLGTSKSKHGNTPCKRKVLTGQSKVKKSLKIFQPVFSEDPDDDFMDSRTVKRAPLPLKHKVCDGQKISPRNTPRNLCGVIQVLTDEQKEVVKAMGFGAFLDMKLTQIPTALAYWLVNNYDVGTGSLVTVKGVVKIDAKLINSVLGVPLGTETITIIEKTTDRDPVTKEWRSQFEEGKTKITLHDTLMMMKDRKDAGRLFQLNFLVVLCTSVIRVMQSGTVNQCFLNAITPGTDVKNMRWFNNTGAGDDTDLKLVNADAIADLENVNINSNVAENGKGTEVGTVVHEDSVGQGNHDSLKGIEDNGNDIGTVVHEDSVGQFKPDSLKGKKRESYVGETDMFIINARFADVYDAVDDDALTIVKGIGPENADVVERTLVDDDDRDHEVRVNECNSLAIEADMGKVDAGTMVSVEALHVEEDKTHSGADYVNKEEHVSVLIDDFKMDTQDVDYYRAQFESEHEMNVDGDGNDRLLYIKKCISDFQDCYIQVINTLRIAEREYPHSDAIRQNKWEWGQMVRKLSSEMEKNGNSIVSGSMSNRGVEAMHKSGVLKSTEMGSKVRDERFESNSGSGSYFADGDLGEAALEDGKTPYDKGKSKVKMSTIEDSYDTFKTPEQIVKLLDCHIPTDEEVNLMGRPKRRTTLPDALRSPFANRRVLLIIRRSGLENNVGNYVFSSCGSKWDIVYNTKRGGDVIRAHMESLCPGVKVHANVIGAWSKVLNNDRIYRQMGSPVRLFCSTNMLTKESYKKSVMDAERIKEFTANMETVLYVDELLTVYGLDMVFIPIAFDDHNYVLCFNLKKARIDLLDHSGDGEGYWKKYKGWPEMMEYLNINADKRKLMREGAIARIGNRLNKVDRK
ncbi:hypothetical protein SSX86_016370 [Deinandra increscens subsp. villosa]|uniref:Uncharacterized protein n=1 Tax=Deinandra increscens subsp. villosa TaxID=3103831 RepID=A0AAP0D2K2_9ASTR